MKFIIFCRHGGKICSEDVTRFVNRKNIVKQVDECSTCVVFVYPQLHRFSVLLVLDKSHVGCRCYGKK